MNSEKYLNNSVENIAAARKTLSATPPADEGFLSDAVSKLADAREALKRPARRSEHKLNKTMEGANKFLPLEQEYAYYLLQLSVNTKAPGKFTPEENQEKLELVRQQLVNLGERAGKSGEEISRRLAEIKEWAERKASGVDEPARAAAAGKEVSEIFVRPGANPNRPPSKGGGREWFPETGKSALVEEALKRLKINFLPPFIEPIAELEKKRMMREPYREFVLPDRGKLILVCDTAQNNTYVMHGVEFGEDVSGPPVTFVRKAELEADPRVDTFEFFKYDPAAWEKIIEFTIQHPGEKRVDWKNKSDAIDILKVTSYLAPEILQSAWANYPDLRPQLVREVKKAHGGERIYWHVTAEAYEQIKENLEEEKKIPEGKLDMELVCRLLYAEFGGEEALGSAYEKLRVTLRDMVEFYSGNAGKRSKVDRVKLGSLTKVGRTELLLFDKQEGEDLAKDIARRKEDDFKHPLRPDNFIAESLMTTGAEIISANNLEGGAKDRRAIAMSIQHLLARASKWSKSRVKLYNPDTHEGNLGHFRESVLSDVTVSFNENLKNQILDYFRELIEKNKKLPKLEEGEITIGDLIEEFLAEHKQFNFPKFALYQYIFNRYGLRDADFKTGGVRAVGAGSLSRKVKNIYDGEPKVFVAKSIRADLIADLNNKCEQEAKLPIVEDDDIRAVNLIAKIAEDLASQGIEKNTNAIWRKIKRWTAGQDGEATALPAYTEKRTAAGNFAHAICYKPKDAEVVKKEVCAYYLATSRGEVQDYA